MDYTTNGVGQTIKTAKEYSYTARCGNSYIFRQFKIFVNTLFILFLDLDAKRV